MHLNEAVLRSSLGMCLQLPGPAGSAEGGCPSDCQQTLLPSFLCCKQPACDVASFGPSLSKLFLLQPAAGSMNGGLLATLHWCTLAAGAGNKQLQVLPALQWLTQLVQARHSVPCCLFHQTFRCGWLPCL